MLETEYGQFEEEIFVLINSQLLIPTLEM